MALTSQGFHKFRNKLIIAFAKEYLKQNIKVIFWTAVQALYKPEFIITKNSSFKNYYSYLPNLACVKNVQLLATKYSKIEYVKKKKIHKRRK